jgi:peptide-methionine (S)-S-oxide reductase
LPVAGVPGCIIGRLGSGARAKRIAEAYIKQQDQAKAFRAPIVTQVVPLLTFCPAEEHHQNYCNRPTDRYVQEVAMPKVEKAKKQVPEMLKK